MKVVVLWEDSREIEMAENLANVLVSLAPTLCMAEVDKNGGVTQTFRHNMAVPKVGVQARSFTDLFRRVPKKIHNWGGQMVKTIQDGSVDAIKPAWQDIPGLIDYLVEEFGVERGLVENLVCFADSARA